MLTRLGALLQNYFCFALDFTSGHVIVQRNAPKLKHVQLHNVRHVILVVLQATSLLGKFMVMNKDRYSFVQWLAEKTGASSQQALDCFKCLDAWTDAFM